MTMPLSLARRIHSGRLTLSDLQAEAERTLAARSTASRRKAPRRVDGERKKRLTREERAGKVTALREKAYAFTGGRCPVCMVLLDDVWQLHHLVSGGLRRAKESERNTVALCRACHHLAHDGDLSTLNALHTWALANGDSECRRAMVHRIEKVMEARR